MKFYYVKLSCPSTIDDPKFRDMLSACKENQIKKLEFTNIPNNINELQENDFVVFILSGDVGNKNIYFKDDEKLKNFINGIHAIGKVTSITPSDKKFTAEIYPLNESVSRDQLYPYPQFSDNLGVMTKGSPNQAGLYNLNEDIYLSLLDYLTQNQLINSEYDLLKEANYLNKLAETANQNPIFLKAKKLESFKALGLTQSTQSNPASSTHEIGRDYLIKNFCDWFKKPENYKASYEGLVTKKVLISWDSDFFNDQIFNIRATNIKEDIAKIKKIIDGADSNLEWSKFNESTSKGAPKAVLGKNNYLSFLDNFSKDPIQVKAYENSLHSKVHTHTDIAIKLSKPFILLAGISGTGKTRFIREQATKSGAIDKTYRLIPVRPDWHEPSDILGYVSRITGKPTYIVTDVLRFIVNAWISIADTNISYQNKVIKGNIHDLEMIPPYWLCLDEMNLAPVEQYFSDFLSILETRLWVNNYDLFEYSCDALLSSKLIEDGGDQLRNDLDLSDDKYTSLWQWFSTHGIGIPPNLIIAGTVNMDETTHRFSRKVLDRALSFDFGDFFPNDFDTYFSPATESITLSYPTWSNAANEVKALSKTIDKDGARSVEFLSSINETLEGSYFKLAYRSLNDLLLSVIAFKPQSEIEIASVWDDFVMCKILPRIEGDFDKLAIHNNLNTQQKNILTELNSLLEKKLSIIWEGTSRSDLYRRYSQDGQNISNEANNSSDISNLIPISCRSKNKIAWMNDRLTNTSFTSYWP
jgi:hypothetical protein